MRVKGLARSPKRDLDQHPNLTSHFLQDRATPEKSSEASPNLLRRVAESKHSTADTRMAYASCTAYPHALNGDPNDDGAELMAVSKELLSSSYFHPDHSKQLRMIGKLTTSRVAYSNLLEGEGGKCLNYLQGVSAKPLILHELPYGSECPELIGEKTSIYRQDFTPKSPRPFEQRPCYVKVPRATEADLRSKGIKGIPSPPSPRGSTGDGKLKQSYVNTYRSGGGDDDTPSGKAERNIDTQARRELEWLRASAESHGSAAALTKTYNSTILTPRSAKREQEEKESRMSETADGTINNTNNDSINNKSPRLPSVKQPQGEEYVSVPRSYFSTFNLPSPRGARSPRRQ